MVRMRGRIATSWLPLRWRGGAEEILVFLELPDECAMAGQSADYCHSVGDAGVTVDARCDAGVGAPASEAEAEGAAERLRAVS